MTTPPGFLSPAAWQRYQFPRISAAPPITLTNTAEGGTDTTAVTTGNSGGASGDAWNAIGNSGNNPTFAAAGAVQGALGYSITTTAAGVCYLEWTGALTKVWAEAYTRIYFKLPTALPTANDVCVRWINGGTNLCRIQVTTAGALRVIDSAGTAVLTFTTTLTTGTWYRLDSRISFPNAQVGVGLFQLFVGANVAGAVPDETQGDLTTSRNWGSLPLATFRTGWTNGVASQSQLLVDNIILSQTVLPPTVAAPVAGVAVAAGVAPDQTVQTTSGGLSVNAEVAASSAVALAPVVAETVNPPAAASSGVALAPSPAETANAAVATALSQVTAGKASETISPPAASSAGVALAPTPAVVVLPPAAVSADQALAPATSGAGNPPAAVAAGVAPAPTPAVTVFAGVAVAAGVAPQPSVQTSGGVSANAAVAVAAGVALASTPALTAQPPAAASAVQITGPRGSVGVLPAPATGAAVGPGPVPAGSARAAVASSAGVATQETVAFGLLVFAGVAAAAAVALAGRASSTSPAAVAVALAQANVAAGSAVAAVKAGSSTLSITGEAHAHPSSSSAAASDADRAGRAHPSTFVGYSTLSSTARMSGLGGSGDSAVYGTRDEGGGIVTDEADVPIFDEAGR